MKIRIGTRSSRLALWQARRVADHLLRARPGMDIAVVELSTHGDESGDRALPEIGGEGLFTERIERALLDGAVDVAVHSLKDLPVDGRPGLVVGAVLDRDEVREALVSRGGATLAALSAGSIVGSSSTRRRAQLLAARPDLVVRPIRGNVETRIGKVESGQYDATVLAGAGIARLGLEGKITEWLDIGAFLPAPGQGALAVQCRADDSPVREALHAIDDPGVHAATDAEREFLRLLGCGCSAPVAALAVAEPGTISMRARVSAPDGGRVIDVQGSGADPFDLARDLARRARDAGADAVLAGLRAAPLQGRRVMVTRSAAQAAELCELLESRGAIPVPVPMIRTDAVTGSALVLRDAVKDMGAFAWVVFTSANAVDAFMRQAGLRLGSAGAGPLVAAVGPATVGALARHGIAASFVPAEFSAEALAHGLAANTPRGIAGARVLFPRAEKARDAVTSVLSARGAEVVEIPLYRTSAAVVEPAALAQLEEGVDAILFMSGSAVDAFSDNARNAPRLSDAARTAVIGCVGPSTAEAARAGGLPVHFVADKHTAAGLVNALERYFGAGRAASASARMAGSSS